MKCRKPRVTRAPMAATGTSGEFTRKRAGIARRARERALTEIPAEPAAFPEGVCEPASILILLENSLTNPWIRRRVVAGTGASSWPAIRYRGG